MYAQEEKYAGWILGWSSFWGDLEEEEEEEENEVEEEIEKEGLEDGIQIVDSLSSTPTGVETPDAIDLRKQQRKEPKGLFTKYLRRRKKGLHRAPCLEHLIPMSWARHTRQDNSCQKGWFA